MKMIVENLELNDYYGITLTTRNNKILYLEMCNGKPEWTFNKKHACIWDSEEMAEKFAKSWFKNFKNYKIQPILKM